MRFRRIMGVLTAVFVVGMPIAAQAQDGSRVVMRRPLNTTAQDVPADARIPPADPNACGGPANPCADECRYWDPQWSVAASDPSVCIGDEGAANAICQAFLTSDRSGPLTAVPDSVCLEEAASYTARCG